MDTSAMVLSFWPTRTRLQPPAPRHDTIARPQLLARLHTAIFAARLTLISAPAGYGKTTLLASFAAAHPDLALAWLTLDAGDNDPAQFLVALIAATQHLSPNGGRGAAHLLASLPTPATEIDRVIGRVFADLAPTLPVPSVLVLDDVQMITEPTSFAVLDCLLERLPPHLHLVVATRHDPPLPLAQLQARQQLAEVRLTDLRFTPEETATFLNADSLTAAQLALLHGRTDGCAAGLSLAISALNGQQGSDERATLLEQLAGTDRHAFDFLANAALARQEPATRDFLLTTALLTELTPARCAAVTGQPDAGNLLDALARHHPFLLPVGHASHTYRYHDLFGEFLRGHLARERAADLPALHRRAAQAEREAGLPNRAIGHYLAATAWDDAASLIAQVGMQLLEQRALATLRGWIAPVPEAVQEAHPHLPYLLGVIAWDNGHAHEARPLLERALVGFQARGDREGEGAALAALIPIFAGVGAFPRAMSLFDRALALPQRPHSRVALLLGRGFWKLVAGHWPETSRDIEAALAVAEATPDPRTLRALAINIHVNQVLLPGAIPLIDRIQRLATTIAGEGREDQILQANAAKLVATAALWRGDWATATTTAEHALALATGFDALILVELATRALLTGCAAIAGDNAAADRHCAGILAALERPAFATFHGWRATFLHTVGRVRVLQGRLDDARAIAAQLDAHAQPGDWPGTPGGRLILRGMIAQAEGDQQTAERTFREATALLRPHPDALWFGDPELLVAATRLAQGHPNEVLALLATILTECEDAGTPGRLRWNGHPVVAPLLRLAIERGLHTDFATSVRQQLDTHHPQDQEA